MHIHYLQHVPFEGPGVIETWANSNDHLLTGTNLFVSEELPAPADIDALVVMGGPMGVGDEHKYRWLRGEKKYIKKCINKNKKVLGICLGAQLVAGVLGADVCPMLEKEIGWFPVNWTRQARDHFLLDFLPAQQPVLHWHGDMFDLPENALYLASSNGCENQGFLFDGHILGLQFHLEMTKAGLSELIDNSTETLGEGRFVQDAEQMLTEGYFEQAHKTMYQMLDRFIQK